MFSLQISAHFILDRPKMKELTSMGAAICAGVGAGIDMKKSTPIKKDSFQPSESQEYYEQVYLKWKKSLENQINQLCNKNWI